MKNHGKLNLAKASQLSEEEMKFISGGYGDGGACPSEQAKCYGSCTVSGYSGYGTCKWIGGNPVQGYNYRCSCQGAY